MLLKWTLAVCIGISSSVLLAQQAPGSNQIVKNLPYTAQQVTTVVQIRPDGSKFTTMQQTDFARNSAGSVSCATHAAVSGTKAGAPGSSPVVFTSIFDAKKGQAIYLNQASKTATVTTLPSVLGTPVNNHVSLFHSGFSKPSAPQSIGTNTLLGFAVTGLRTTRTSLPSSVAPMTVTTDTWSSPALSIVLAADTENSLGGSSKTALANLVQGEPDPSLFAIPSGYTTTK